MNCLTCKFWKPSNQFLNPLGVMVPADHKDANPTGLCHRYPPLPVRGQTTGWRQFPTTIDDDTCGEYSVNEALPKGPPKPEPVVAAVEIPAPAPAPLKKKRWMK